jgi:hypothetical protein
MSSDDYCRGFDNGHKMGFDAGFKAAIATFEKMSFDLNHEISFFPDERIDARYQDWFGKSNAIEHHAAEPEQEDDE